ncbi:MAG TPA: glutaminase [Saprospiraceae bacterium]|nr:glutaminase [Saprospiraceae bacterium]HRK83956.1 glutaminase [Saprospiraceae bacterium]
MSHQHIIEGIYSDVQPFFGRGKVADYIPALARVRPDQLGIALQTLDGQTAVAGDSEIRFSIQSISKTFTLALAFALEGNDLWKRVGVEPSGNPFNSLVQLEFENGKPRNPFINAGALVVTDVLCRHYDDPKSVILNLIRSLAGSDDISFDEEVAASEKATGFRNQSLAWFLKSCGNLHSDVDTVLDVYFHQCSIAMNCRELSRAFLFLANHGVHPYTGEAMLTRSQAKRLNAILLTCGFYDQAGEFAFRVGMPGKSGVGGGVAAFIPGELAVAVWSPELNEHGNSVVGMQVLEWFTTRTGRSIF